LSTVKAPAHARMPGDGTRDTVAVHAGTAKLISDTIDRIFGTVNEAGRPVERAECAEAAT
jgi:hypothetical protein